MIPTDDDTETLHRRRLLSALGVAAATAVAGCGGDGSDDDEDDEDEDDSDPDATETQADDENDGGLLDGQSGDDGDGMDGGSGGDGMDGGSGDDSSGDGGSGCPSPSSISYSEQALARVGDDDPLASIDVPDSADSQEVVGVLYLDVPVGGEQVSITVSISVLNRSMDDIVGLSGDNESTSEYDFAVEGTRSVTQQDSDGEVPATITVYVPRSDESLLSVTINQTTTPAPCPDAVNAILTRMVESIRLA